MREQFDIGAIVAIARTMLAIAAAAVKKVRLRKVQFLKR